MTVEAAWNAGLQTGTHGAPHRENWGAAHVVTPTILIGVSSRYARGRGGDSRSPDLDSNGRRESLSGSPKMAARRTGSAARGRRSRRVCRGRDFGVLGTQVGQGATAGDPSGRVESTQRVLPQSGQSLVRFTVRERGAGRSIGRVLADSSEMGSKGEKQGALGWVPWLSTHTLPSASSARRGFRPNRQKRS